MERRGVSLNLNVRGLGHSATLQINETVQRMRAAGHPVFNMGLGESPFPVPAPVVERLRDHAHEKAYLPVAGLPALRQGVAAYLHRNQGLERDAQDVLIGPGSKELLFLLQLSFYGDIIVPSPCWVSYTPQAQILGRRVKVVDTRLEDGWKVTPDLLAAVLQEDSDKYRPRIFVLNYPANPTGVSYSDQELRALAQVAREYEVIILSDEIYSGLRHDGQHVSIARHYPEGTIILDGISKWAGAGGWRLGAFIFPAELEWLRDTMAAVASETYTSVCTPVQYAAVRAFENGELEPILERQRRILDALTGHVHARLREADVRVVRPDGAYYIFPDFTGFRRRLSRRRLDSGAAFCQAVLEETGVAMLPGSAFRRPKQEPTARMSLVDFDGAAALAALEGTPDETWLRDHAPGVVAGMDRLFHWLDRR